MTRIKLTRDNKELVFAYLNRKMYKELLALMCVNILGLNHYDDFIADEGKAILEALEKIDA